MNIGSLAQASIMTHSTQNVGSSYDVRPRSSGQGSVSGGRQITRNRASYSCHACRRRKVKCDKVDPRAGGRLSGARAYVTDAGAPCMCQLYQDPRRLRLRYERRNQVQSNQHRQHPEELHTALHRSGALRARPQAEEDIDLPEWGKRECARVGLRG